MQENFHEIVMIDYGLGNLLSVKRAIQFCGFKTKITSDPKVVVKAKKVILPGVGSFQKAMDELNKKGLTEAITEISQKRVSILAICLGMQLLLDESEENGITKGLSLIPGIVKKIPEESNNIKLKVPHIGWSSFSYFNKKFKPDILNSINTSDYFYFVHSYYSILKNKDFEIAKCNYGGLQINSIIKKNNIIGCQFHPEKSGKAGLKVLKNFCKS